MYSTLHCVSHRKGITQKMYTHVFYVYSTGPGGEDLEGGYYDAGDNLKVICDHHYWFMSICVGLFDVNDTFQKCNSDD